MAEQPMVDPRQALRPRCRCKLFGASKSRRPRPIVEMRPPLRPPPRGVRHKAQRGDNRHPKQIGGSGNPQIEYGKESGMARRALHHPVLLIFVETGRLGRKLVEPLHRYPPVTDMMV